jgi:putative transposase
MDYPELREEIEKGIEVISEWMGCEIKEKNVREDHVHIIVSISPKVSVSKCVGTLKGKIAIKIFKVYKGLKKQKYCGNHFWARGYFVSTIGIDEEMIRRYVKYQEKE